MIRNRSVSYPSVQKQSEIDKELQSIIGPLLNPDHLNQALDDQLLRDMIAGAFSMQPALMSAPERMPRISDNVILSQEDLDRINGIPVLNQNIFDLFLDQDDEIQEARPDGLY